MKKYRVVIVALLVVFGFTVYGLFFRPSLIVPKADVKATYSLPNSHFINFQGAEIHFTESGADSSFPIIMIHGFGGSNRDFYVLDSLVNDKYRVIRVDLPGFGMSDFPPQQSARINFMQVYTDYFNFLLDTLHIDSCYVMGNSLGGLMACQLTLNRPDVVKKLVLFNSAGYEMPEVMKSANASLLQNSLVQQVVKLGAPEFVVEQGVKRVVFDASSLTPEKLTRVATFWNRQGNMEHLIAMATTDSFPDENRIKQIACPTLIVWGKQDKIVAPKYAERFHADIKGSRVIMYDSCGHVPMLERPEDVKHDVLLFLNEAN